MDESKTVTLMNFSSPERAEIYRSLLASMGIDSAVINGTANEVLPLPPNSIRLIVNERDYRKAKDLLNAKIEKEPLNK